MRHLLNYFNETKTTLRCTGQKFKDVHASMLASSLAYTTILSLIPFLAVSLALFKGFGGMEKLYTTLEPFLIENLSTGSGEVAAEWIRQFIGNVRTAELGGVGLLGLVVTSLLLLDSAEKAVQKIWGIKKRRPMVERMAYYWAIVTIGPITLATVLGATTADTIHLPAWISKGFGGFLIPFIVFLILNRVAPMTYVRWKPALIASAVSASIWASAGSLYGLYVKHFVSYNKIYGSLGALPILLVWIYVGWIIVLSGFVLCATLQERLHHEPHPPIDPLAPEHERKSTLPRAH